MCYIHNDHHYHSLYARWLGGVCRRLSSNAGERCFPHERPGSFCRIILFAQTGCDESVAFDGGGQGVLRPLFEVKARLKPYEEQQDGKRFFSPVALYSREFNLEVLKLQ